MSALAKPAVLDRHGSLVTLPFPPGFASTRAMAVSTSHCALNWRSERGPITRVRAGLAAILRTPTTAWKALVMLSYMYLLHGRGSRPSKAARNRPANFIADRVAARESYHFRN